jgi:hypothetical protein
VTFWFVWASLTAAVVLLFLYVMERRETNRLLAQKRDLEEQLRDTTRAYVSDGLRRKGMR